MTADEILTNAVREVVAAYRLGRRIDRTVPVATCAEALFRATCEAAELMPTEPAHLGAVWESRWAA